ncbi:MAG TPA: hypothetical protein VIK10_05680 [Prolixibacteraceae bacterium]
MTDSKIDFSFENLHFSCEGDNAWVERQLNNVLSRIPALLAVHKMGESIVEDVIDVQEIKPRATRSKATVKPGKVKAVKTVKEEVAKEPEVKAPKAPKAAKAPKIKASKVVKTPKEKAPKAVKVPKEKAPKAVKVAKEMTPKVAKVPKVKVEKAVKVAKVKVPKVPKVKKVSAKAKKKVVKKSPFIEKKDSPLYQFLLERKAEKNQIRKFLATGVFLTRSNDSAKLSTSMISNALKSAGIEKLLNASDCLNKNEARGYCLKEGKEFVVTENGFLSVS